MIACISGLCPEIQAISALKKSYSSEQLSSCNVFAYATFAVKKVSLTRERLKAWEMFFTIALADFNRL